jgi:hypothetical protein
MKRIVLAVLLVLGLGLGALATGPVVGIGIEPNYGAQASFSAGWAFDQWKILGTKEAFDTWYGDWSISAMWTPDWGYVDGRIGLLLGWDWESGGLYYNDLAFVVGVQKSWGVPGIYAQFEIGTSTLLIPRVGFELQFDLPKAADTST